MARLVLANTVNDVMAEGPSDGYRTSMSCVTPRKLWLAEPGDTLILSAPPTQEFLEYVGRIRDADLGLVHVIAPESTFTGHVLDLVDGIDSDELGGNLEEIFPFVLDSRVVEFARRFSLPLKHYSTMPGPETLEAVSRLNTKSGFRSAAKALGIPVLPGATAATLRGAAEVAGGLAMPQILKKNRSSNGWANAYIEESSPSAWAAARHETIGDSTDSFSEGWLVEEFRSFDALPSMECLVSDAGVEPYYSCGQRSVNNAWTGMETPYGGAMENLLWEYAFAYGNYLHGLGYRGYFDLDCGVLGNEVFATETNVRRTGGTYLHQLARDLSGHASPIWRADVGPGRTDLSFAEGVSALRAIGVEPGVQEGACAVLTVDTLHVDGKWRYLVAGANFTEVAGVEDLVRSTLGMN